MTRERIDNLEALARETSQEPWQVEAGGDQHPSFHLASLGRVEFSVVTYVSQNGLTLEQANQRKKDLLYLQTVKPGIVIELCEEIKRLRGTQVT